MNILLKRNHNHDYVENDENDDKVSLFKKYFHKEAEKKEKLYK